MAIIEDRQKDDTVVMMNVDNFDLCLGLILFIAEHKSPTGIARTILSDQS